MFHVQSTDRKLVRGGKLHYHSHRFTYTTRFFNEFLSLSMNHSYRFCQRKNLPSKAISLIFTFSPPFPSSCSLERNNSVSSILLVAMMEGQPNDPEETIQRIVIWDFFFAPPHFLHPPLSASQVSVSVYNSPSSLILVLFLIQTIIRSSFNWGQPFHDQCFFSMAFQYLFPLSCPLSWIEMIDWLWFLLSKWSFFLPPVLLWFIYI